ncbi:MAG: protein-export chaperone SecB [Betaproteobacteria bacterium]|nr:protein-export chaperone SecB [Betaproteobacteria bacterium]
MNEQTPILGAASQPATDAPVFSIERIYVKDMSLENPSSPQSFLLQDTPQIEVSLQTRGEPVGDGVFESVLTVTVTAKVGEQTIFLIEVAQAGIFQIRNIPEADMQPILGVHCPGILFPYARETVASAIMRAGYPPVHLAPINFEALYAQQMQQMQAAQAPQSSIIQTAH